MTAVAAEGIVTLLASLMRGDEAAVLEQIERTPPHHLLFPALFRTAVFHSARLPLYYRRLLNCWTRGGCPPLKSGARNIVIEVLSDGTMGGIEPPLRLFCAVYGLNASIVFGDFDGVEQQAFGGETTSEPDFTLVFLSDDWLRRQCGSSLVPREKLQEVKRLLGAILEGLKARRRGEIIAGCMAGGAFSPPSSCVSSEDLVGWTLVLAEINLFLAQAAGPRVHLLDTAAAMHLAGGASAMGRRNFLRARAPFEEAGLIALAREAAAGIAHSAGRLHRALLTDWDNTLWEGEVGEAGFHGIVCGQDSPDALGYHLLQTYCRNLTEQGILLAAVSRNAPEAARVLDENPNLVLKRRHFAHLALSWGTKSESIGEIGRTLNFGPEFMLYLDDSPVELAEMLSACPDMDVVPAGPTGDATLERLVRARFFTALTLSRDDVQRPGRSAVLAAQQEALRHAPDRRQFLASLQMRLVVSSLTADNLERVLQLLQKTNQFNLTTRRHTAPDLEGLRQGGARFGVFHYEDKFGAQGIIGLVILLPGERGLSIDTWLMSCRVLHRTVEHAMFRWVVDQAEGRPVSGCYCPTPKNSLVSDLYPRLGFVPHPDNPSEYIYLQAGGPPAPQSLELIYE